MSERRAKVARFSHPARVLAVALLIAASAGPLACSDDPAPDVPGAGGGASSGACPSDLPTADVCASGVPSYRLDAAPIIERRCATCHYPGNNQSRYVFIDHEDLYADRQVVLTRIYGCVMPPDGAPPLTEEERRTILEWFVCGAPDN